MSSFLDMARRVAQYLGRTDRAGEVIIDLEPQIKAEITYVLEELNRKTVYITELRGGILSTVEEQTWYSELTIADTSGSIANQPARQVSVKDIIDLRYMRESPGGSGLNEPMQEVSYEHFEFLQEGLVQSGEPEVYTRYSGQIGIWPIPQGGLTLYWSGTVRPIIPVTDTDTSIWFTEYSELVTAAAAARVCEKYLRNPEWAIQFRHTEMMQKQVLEAENVQQSSSGFIRPYQ